ncbi:hypothetical protein ACJX0J_026426, partial [Zea mays]
IQRNKRVDCTLASNDCLASNWACSLKPCLSFFGSSITPRPQRAWSPSSRGDDRAAVAAYVPSPVRPFAGDGHDLRRHTWSVSGGRAWRVSGEQQGAEVPAMWTSSVGERRGTSSSGAGMQRAREAAAMR